MWVLLSFALGVLLVWILFIAGMRLDIALLAGIVYYMYMPRRNRWIRDARLWTWFRETHLTVSYTGKTEILRDKEQARCFAAHPHGAHCVGAIAMASDARLEHIRVACTSVLFWLPVLKEFVSWGNAIPVVNEQMVATLKSGDSIMVYPGAFNELPGATFMRDACAQDPDNPAHAGWDAKDPAQERHFTYSKRKGFIRVAKEAGVPLVPVWVEGEYDLYKVYHPWPRLQRKVYAWTKYPGPFYSCGWWGSFWPRSHPLKVYIGKEIETDKDDVDTLHALFYKELQRLKDKCK